MSARDVIAKAVDYALDAKRNAASSDRNDLGMTPQEFSRHVVCETVQAYLSALNSSGYRILGPDEIDAVTVEKCAEVAEGRAEWVPLKTGDMRTAIHALCATHQGDK